MADAGTTLAGPHGPVQGALVMLATAALYVAAAKLGLSLAVVAEQVTTVWPPTGIAIAAVWLLGPRWTAPGIALGAFLANVTAPREHVSTALGIAAGNTLEALTAVAILTRAGFRPALGRLRDVLALVGLATPLSTALAATIGVIALCTTGVQPWTGFGGLWWTWWIGDALGAIVAGPLLLVWLSAPAVPQSVARRLESAALVLTTFGTAAAVFRAVPMAVPATYPLHYTVFPMVVWAALRFGQRGTVTVTALVAAVAIASTVAGSGPFATASRHEALLMLQLFMAVVAVTGLLLGSAITERDESRRRRLEDYQSLRVSEERLRLALEAGQMGVWDWDIARGTVRWSENLEAIHGLPPGTFDGTFQGFQKLVQPDDWPRVEHAIADAVAVGGSYDAEFRTIRGDGSIGWISANGRVLPDRTGRAARMIGVCMDVTDRRRLAEELEARAGELTRADRRKDEFLAMLAHELRNPLAPLTTALELLGAGKPGAEPHLAIAERQARQLARLVDDLLDVSRITQGRVTLRAEPVTMAHVVERALETVSPALQAHGHVVDVRLPGDPLVVLADPGRLAQVLSNLLDNAAKYTPPGGSIRLVAEEAGDTVVIRVCDTGAGLPPDLAPNVFDLFVQGDRTLARTQGGLGIGLTIVRRLVELHGGRVEARSPGVGRGSEFLVYLPALAASVPDASPQARPAPDGTSRRLRVLVVEDNHDAAEVLGTILELWGHEVRTAFDAVAALEAMAAWSPEVVLSDLGLPRMDGYELARRIRAAAPNGVVLIALSGYGRDDDRRAAFDAGFDHHVVKPPDLAALAELLAGIAAARDTGPASSMPTSA
jgi:PAS domain S-box-containing protein